MTTVGNLTVILILLSIHGISASQTSGSSSAISNFHKLRIVGGVDAERDEFPFVVSLTRRGRHFCGASILNAQFLITAGHCLCSSTNKMVKPASFRAIIGLYKQGGLDGDEIDKAYEIGVKKIIPHPEYQCEEYNNDIALLEVEKPLTLTTGQSCCLPDTVESNEEDNRPVTVMGWGWDQEDVSIGNKPEILQKALIAIISNDRCQKSYSENNKRNIISDTQMCAGRLEGGIDACWSDSGGPLIDENNILIGIVSTGIGCARPGLPGIYTRVSKYISWINDVIKQ